jgi:hypothetical protein
VSRNQRQLDLVNTFDEHQSIHPALTFIVTQFNNVFDPRVLKACDIH